ncbi:MAG: His Kinase A (phospho-acceptor) domain protein [Candidatus Aminicenantes bacterium ADurb.Bin508]|nr:MAG: His Kinase A (phospho-acceptor) domain protein [Candidatus Aminicenantes bacterium ADurb.Bin508]
MNKNTADLKAVIGQLEEKTKELSTLKRDFLESERNLSLYIMVSGLAHEINNPLTTILGYLELLIAGKKLPGKALAEGEKLYEKLFAMKESLSRLSELHADEEEGELYEMALWVRSTFGHIKGVTVDSSASSFYAFGHRERLAEAFTEWLSISGKAGAQGWRFSFRQRENENRVLLETTFPSVPDEVEIKKASLNLQLKLSQEGNTEWSFQGKTLTLAFLPSSG